MYLFLPCIIHSLLQEGFIYTILGFKLGEEGLDACVSEMNKSVTRVNEDAKKAAKQVEAAQNVLGDPIPATQGASATAPDQTFPATTAPEQAAIAAPAPERTVPTTSPEHLAARNAMASESATVRARKLWR